MRPGIIEGVTKDMPLYSQEIFAPVAMLFKVSSLDEAITLANDSPLGLSSVLFSNDEGEHETAINTLEAGSTYINRYASLRHPYALRRHQKIRLWPRNGPRRHARFHQSKNGDCCELKFLGNAYYANQ